MKNVTFIKLVVFINALVPLSLLLWDAQHGQNGADPVNFAIHTTGMLALIFLFLSLSVTPLRLISGKNYLSNFRRMLGLFAFFYGVVHLSIYFFYLHAGRFGEVFRELVNPKNRFIFFGMAALLLMAPLAATSTNWAIKKMGSLWWKRLHRLAYVSAICGAIHYYMSVKADTRKPIVFLCVLSMLLLYRVLVKYFPALKYTRRPAVAARMG